MQLYCNNFLVGKRIKSKKGWNEKLGEQYKRGQQLKHVTRVSHKDGMDFVREFFPRIVTDRAPIIKLRWIIKPSKWELKESGDRYLLS